MGKKQKGKKGGEQKKEKGSKGAGNANHKAKWNSLKVIRNAVRSNGYVEAYLIALDAEDAGLPGLWNFQNLETGHYDSNGKWEQGSPASWMVLAREAVKAKVADPVELLMKIGKRYAEFNSGPQGDKSMAYRRITAVALKLYELGPNGSAALGKLEGEAIEGRLSWFLESMTAAELRAKTEEARKASEEAARKQAASNAEKQAANRKG